MVVYRNGGIVILLVLVIAAYGTHAADPDPLQDFCVADLDAPSKGGNVNGYLCKARQLVTSDDFLFTGFRNRGTRHGNQLMGTSCSSGFSHVSMDPFSMLMCMTIENGSVY